MKKPILLTIMVGAVALVVFAPGASGQDWSHIGDPALEWTEGNGPGCGCEGEPENEPNCGIPTDTVNGGCNFEPTRGTRVRCGDTICGTVGTGICDQVGACRDTDWYVFETAVPIGVTMIVNSTFPSVAARLDDGAGSPGSPQCPVDAFADFQTNGGTCGPHGVQHNAPAGRTLFFVSTDFIFAGIECGAEYTVTFLCGEVPPDIPVELQEFEVSR